MSGEKVRIAVLGAALFAETGHIPGIRAHPNAEVVALYSRSLERARSMAERTGVPEATDDLDALLARPDIDAVTIVSSNDQHYPYAMAGLAAGKHVFCEKPMALSDEEAARMTREARARGLVHQIAFTFRYTYCVQEMRRRVLAGEIGTPQFVEINGQWFSRLTASAGEETWRDSLALHGSGHLGEMGAHFIDTVNFVCGETSGFISEVAAVSHVVPRQVLDASGHARDADTPDIASFLFRTEDGLQGHVIASRASPPPFSYGVMHTGATQGGHMGYVTVTGDQGALVATFTRGEVEALRQTRPGERWEAVPLPPEASDGQPHGVSRMMGSFAESVLRGQTDGEIDATFDDGYRSQAAVDAVMKAARSKRWTSVATGVS